jgi:hypothetical protein
MNNSFDATNASNEANLQYNLKKESTIFGMVPISQVKQFAETLRKCERSIEISANNGEKYTFCDNTGPLHEKLLALRGF